MEQNNGSNATNGNTGDDAILGNDTQTSPSGSGENNMSNQERPNDSANNHQTGEDVGVSYEQMLLNGRVHDKDGMLKDGENSTSDLMGNAENAARDLARDAKNGVENLMR